MFFEAIQAILLVGIIAAALIALVKKDLLASVVSLAIMSALMAAEFYLLQAPDVAIAEAAVGAGLTTAIYVIAINKTSRWESEEESKQSKSIGLPAINKTERRENNGNN